MKKLLLLNCKDEVIKKYKIYELPFKEEVIIEKSIGLFSDPEPCIIHKTYVMKKMMFEIDEYLDKHIEGENGILKVDEHLPFNYLELPQTISSILVRMK